MYRMTKPILAVVAVLVAAAAPARAQMPPALGLPGDPSQPRGPGQPLVQDPPNPNPPAGQPPAGQPPAGQPPSRQPPAAAPARPPVAANPNRVYVGMSGLDLDRLLRGWGHQTKLSADKEGNPEIDGTVDGWRYTVFFYGCDNARVKRCASLEVFSGFRMNTPPAHERLNEWNRERRFGTAFLEENGIVRVRLSVNVRGGLTEANLLAWFEWYRRVLKEFTDHIGFKR
jgi:hypothetical protein